MKKYLSLVLAVVMILCLIPATTVFAAKEEVINQVELTVVAPVEGEKPAYDKIDGRGYYSDNGAWGTSTRIYKNGIAWYKSSSSYFSPGTTETFNANTSYTVKINLLPKGNFEFSKNVTAKINGKTATVEVFDDGSILAQTTLSSTSSNKTVIKNVDLTVVRPAIGKTPTFAKVDTTQYFSEKYGTVSNCSNGVTWTNQSSGINLTVSNPFKEGVKYRVTYYLTAKDGYKFASNTACTINGTAATLEVTDTNHAKIYLSDLLPGDGKNLSSSQSTTVGTTSKEPDKNSTPSSSDSSQTTGASSTPSNTDESSAPADNQTENQPEKEEQDEGNKKDEGNNDILIWIILGAVIIIALGAAAAIIIIKRKKK